MTQILPAGFEEFEGFSFEFGTGLPVWAGVLLLVVLATGVASYAASRIRGGSRAMRVLLTGLRCAVIVLAVFLLMDPTLTAHRVHPSDQTVAIVFDDSRSMAIPHRDGKSRAEVFRDAFLADEGRLERELKQRFQVAYFGLAEDAYRVSGLAGLRYEGRESRITRGLLEIEREIGQERLAGILLFSDGVEQPERSSPPEQELPKTPVLSVALPETDWIEFEVADFPIPRVDFTDVPVLLDVPVRGEGLKGRTLVVELLGPPPWKTTDAQEVIQSHSITFGQPEETQLARFEFEPGQEGWVSYTVRARLRDTVEVDGDNRVEGVTSTEDTIPENNIRSFLLDLRPKTYRIFYFSGRPNWENAFVRRALAEERQLALTTHIRISEAEKKFVFRGRRSSMSNRLFEGFDPEEVDQPRYDEAVFLRFGRESAPLSEGYPAREEVLFDYDLVVWSDVEYGFFNEEQIRQTRDFVRKRGGTLLLLGGANAFDEAGFSGTLIESMMPVLLPPRRRISGPGTPGALPEDWVVQPTLEGEIAGALNLDPNMSVNREMWDEMPPLSGVNSFAATRPGATVVAEAVREDKSQPLLVHHRYGEGRTAALATGTTWLWKMQRPPGDRSHQRIWKQLFRDLVRESPEPIRMSSRRESYARDGMYELEFRVRDRKFDPREGLQVHLEVTNPHGKVRQLSVEESLEQPGLYRAGWRPEFSGGHALRLSAQTPSSEVIGELEDQLFVDEDLREFLDAEADVSWLQDLSGRTGGRVVSIDELPRLARSIPWTPPESLDSWKFRLWHLPPFYIALVSLLCLEWFLRRRRGLA